MVALKNEEGEWIKGYSVDQLIVSYFNIFFSSSVGVRPMEFLSALKGRVTDSMKEDLTQVFTAKEIEVALKKCILLKLRG